MCVLMSHWGGGGRGEGGGGRKDVQRIETKGNFSGISATVDSLFRFI